MPPVTGVVSVLRLPGHALSFFSPLISGMSQYAFFIGWHVILIQQEMF